MVNAKVLGLNSAVRINGVLATVSAISNTHLTLKSRKETAEVLFKDVNRMIDDKSLVVVR